MVNADRTSPTRYSIEFPQSGSDNLFRPQLEIRQAHGAHDVAVVTSLGKLSNLNQGYKTGAPVRIKWGNRWGRNQFVGYVHHVQSHFGSDNYTTKIVCVGASFPLIAEKQRTFANATADLVVKQIASEYGLLAVTEPHPRVYETISQPSISDWSLLCRMAKETGYVLRAEQTRLVFLSRKAFNEQNRPMAQRLSMVSGTSSNLSAATTLFDFDPILADYLPEKGISNTRKSIKAVDPNTGQSVVIDAGLDGKEDEGVFFKPVAEVTNSVQDAQARLESSIESNRFRHRARALSVGSPVTSPEKFVYISGVPEPYNGYWTVLSVTHRMRDAYQYLMEMEVGTDELRGSEPLPSKDLTVDMQYSISARDTSNYQLLKIMEEDSRLDAGAQDVSGVVGRPFASVWKSTTLTEV